MARPRKLTLTESHYKQIAKLAGYGMSVEQIGDILEISRPTFYRYMEEDPEIKRHLDLGRAVTQAQVAGALVSKAVTGDISAIKWFEMTRAGRSERVEQDVVQTNYVVEVPAAGNHATQEDAIAAWQSEFGKPQAE